MLQNLIRILIEAEKKNQSLIYKTIAEKMGVSEITASKYIEIGIARGVIEQFPFASAKIVRIAKKKIKTDMEKHVPESE